MQELLGGAFDYAAMKSSLAQLARSADTLGMHAPGAQAASSAMPAGPTVQPAADEEDAWEDIEQYAKVCMQRQHAI